MSEKNNSNNCGWGNVTSPIPDKIVRETYVIFNQTFNVIYKAKCQKLWSILVDVVQIFEFSQSMDRGSLFILLNQMKKQLTIIF